MMRARGIMLLVLAVSLLLAGPVSAQQFENLPEAKPASQPPAGAANIGIINIQLAMTRTQEGKKAAEDMQTQFGPRQTKLQQMQEEVRNLESELRNKERTLSDEARLQLARQIEQKRKEFTRAQQDLNDEAEQVQQDYVNRIGEKMQRIIDRYAREKSLSVVLNAVYWFQGGPFVYAAPAVDITEDIVRLYDETYPVQSSATPSQPQAGNSKPTGKQN